MTHQSFFLIVFSVLQIADIWTTMKALSMGKKEMNPLLANLFEKYDPLPVMVAFKVTAISALWWADMYVITGLLCALYLLVINNNLDVIQGRR